MDDQGQVRKKDPPRIPFGAQYISTGLLNRNKLSLWTIGRRHIYKRELITDDLKYIIKQILKGNYDLEEFTELLEDSEQKVLNEILELCDMENIFEIKHYHRDNSKNKLISKFNIMKDEILIGNDSPELLKDFSELLDVLNEKKMLRAEEYKNLKKLIKQ